MANDRRNFLKKAGLGSLGLFGAGSLAGCTTKGQENANQEKTNLDQILKQANKEHTQQFNMRGYAAPALDVVRVGIIGLGNRGSGTAKRLARIEGVEIKALSDLEPERVSAATESIKKHDHNPDGYSGAEDEWKKVCERDDIDLVYTATPWHLHTPICVYAMEHDKHSYTELPAASTIEECWQLVETSERTRKYCFQMASNCHDGMKAIILNMAR